MARKRILPVDAIVELKKDRPSGGKAVPAMPTSIPRLPELGSDFVDDIPF